MCGLLGYLFTKGETATSSDVILKMLAIQRHRGPNDSGVLGINSYLGKFEKMSNSAPECFEYSPPLVFGFNRLSILDLSANGHQPMVHPESGVALMMNGEIYNAFDFREDLLSKGFSFKGTSDTEIVLYMYIAFGLEGMLSRLNGMFALVISDSREKKLYLIRDRMGIKPLYILRQGHRIAFASEMKSFKALPDFHFELDESKLSEFLLFRNAIHDTLFKNIVNIKPGTYLTILPDGEISETEYFDLHDLEQSKHLFDPKLGLEDALRNSVKRQMISDVKLGCQLSGGVDSSLVAAFASAEVEKGSLETISIVFNEPNYTEEKFINLVSKQLNLLSHKFPLEAETYFDLIEEATWHFEQPLNHPNTIGIKLLSKEAKKYVTVLLSGEGADELLAGYDRLLSGTNVFGIFRNFKRILKSKSFWLSYFKIFRNEGKRYVYQTAFSNLESVTSVYSKFSFDDAILNRKREWDSLKNCAIGKKRKYELLTYLPDLLMRQDKMSMAHSIENRVPFLDNEMIYVSLSIPDEELIRLKGIRWEGKAPLKDICAKIFGSEFAYRRKMGFSIPLKTFFDSDEFKIKWRTEYLPGIEKRGIFNVDEVKQWASFPASASAEQLNMLWLLIGFEIWAKQYLD